MACIILHLTLFEKWQLSTSHACNVTIFLFSKIIMGNVRILYLKNWFMVVLKFDMQKLSCKCLLPVAFAANLH